MLIRRKSMRESDAVYIGMLYAGALKLLDLFGFTHVTVGDSVVSFFEFVPVKLQIGFFVQGNVFVMNQFTQAALSYKVIGKEILGH